jgi:hypothetical protein
VTDQQKKKKTGQTASILAMAAVALRVPEHMTGPGMTTPKLHRRTTEEQTE